MHLRSIDWPGRGWSFVVPLILAGWGFVTIGGASLLFRLDTMVVLAWPLVSTLLMSAVSIWLLDRRLHSLPARPMLDRRMAQQAIDRRTHAFWGQGLEIWPYIFAITAVVLIVLVSIRSS